MMVDLSLLFNAHSENITLAKVLGHRFHNAYPMVVKSIQSIYKLFRGVHSCYSAPITVNEYSGFVYPDTPITKYKVTGLLDGCAQQIYIAFIKSEHGLFGVIYTCGYEHTTTTTFALDTGVITNIIVHKVVLLEGDEYFCRSGSAVYIADYKNLITLDRPIKIPHYLTTVNSVEEITPTLGETK